MTIKRKGKCKTKYCRNKTAKGRLECNKCRTKNYRFKNPYTASYHVKKWNAKKKGVPFHLSKEDWIEFVQRTGYLKNKGQYRNDMSVDRPDNTRGYVKGNLQPLTVSENAKKGNEERKWKYIKPDDLPF